MSPLLAVLELSGEKSWPVQYCKHLLQLRSKVSPEDRGRAPLICRCGITTCQRKALPPFHFGVPCYDTSKTAQEFGANYHWGR